MALHQEKKRRKRDKKLMEEFRGREGASAILLALVRSRKPSIPRSIESKAP